MKEKDEIIITHTCSFCHAASIAPTCSACGHRADRRRLDCDCPKCIATLAEQWRRHDEDMERSKKDRAADRSCLAVPDLLAALKKFVAMEKNRGGYSRAEKDAVVGAAEVAIAFAEGEIP